MKRVANDKLNQSKVKPMIFISHGHMDRIIADVLKRHFELWGVPNKKIQMSYGQTFNMLSLKKASIWESERISAIRQSQLFFIIHTFEYDDWQECVFEAGIAMSPEQNRPRIIMCECINEENILHHSFFRYFMKLVMTQEGIESFVGDFHRGKNFIPGVTFYDAKITDQELSKRSDQLYKDIKKVLPFGDNEVMPVGGYGLKPYFNQLMRSHSIFGGDIIEHPNYDLFMLMPFVDELAPVFYDHVKKVANELELSAGRADDLFSNAPIVSEIWAGIWHAKLLVAECTGRNSNVFYETGIAHTLGKHTIIITQSIDDVPFDLRHLRVITYEFTSTGMEELEIKLRKTIKEILKI